MSRPRPSSRQPAGQPSSAWQMFEVRVAPALGMTKQLTLDEQPHYSFRALHTAQPLDRAALVREGAPAAFLTDLVVQLQVPKERVYQTLGVPRATADRKVRNNERLSADTTERALGLARLVGQVEQMLGESGDPDDPALASFDAARWVAGFLDRPHPALGGRKPGEVMDTVDGRAVVSDLVAQLQSGAYA